jgi:hypothetical protein
MGWSFVCEVRVGLIGSELGSERKQGQSKFFGTDNKVYSEPSYLFLQYSFRIRNVFALLEPQLDFKGQVQTELHHIDSGIHEVTLSEPFPKRKA